MCGKKGQSQKSLFASHGRKGQLRKSLFNLLGIDPNRQRSTGHQRRHVPTSLLLIRPARNPIPFPNRENPPKRRRSHRQNGTAPEASGALRHLNEPTESPLDPCSAASICGSIFLLPSSNFGALRLCVRPLLWQEAGRLCNGLERDAPATFWMLSPISSHPSPLDPRSSASICGSNFLPTLFKLCGFARGPLIAPCRMATIRCRFDCEFNN